MGKIVRLCGVVLVMLAMMSVFCCREAAAWGNNTTTVMPSTGGNGGMISVAKSTGEGEGPGKGAVVSAGSFVSSGLQWLDREEKGQMTVNDYITALQNPATDLRWMIAEKLGDIKISDRSAVPALITSLTDADEGVRIHSAGSLGNLGDIRAIEPLTAALSDSSHDVVRNSAVSLGKLQASSAIEPMINRLNASLANPDESWYVREGLVYGLCMLGDESARAFTPIMSSIEAEGNSRRAFDMAMDLKGSNLYYDLSVGQKTQVDTKVDALVENGAMFDITMGMLLSD